MEVIKKYLLKKLLLKRSFLVMLPVLLFLGAFVPSHFAHAASILGSLFSIGDITAGAVLSVISAVLSILIYLAVWLAALAGSFMDSILHWDMFYTKCTAAVPADVCFIDVAWKVMRDLVNTLLIISLVIIALFTILGSREYGVGKALIPFIVVALLVNFSRVFVGVVVDLSNVVMQIFLTAIPRMGDVGAFVDKTGVVGLDNFSFSASAALGNLVQTIVLILFFAGLALILTLYSVIFAVRFGMIWLLTIISPIAFAAWLFPPTKKFFTMWRDQLVQWSIIGIPLLFFLWVAMMFALQIEAMKPPPQASGGEAFFAEIMPSLLSLMVLVLAFVVGMKTSAMGSSMIISTSKKFGAAAGKFGTKAAWRVGAIGARKAAPTAGRIAGRAGRLGGITARKIGGAPPLRAMGAWKKNRPQKRYEKMRKAAITGGTGSTAEKRFLKMQKKAGLINVSKWASWATLNDAQKGKVIERMRSKTAKGAAAILGGGRNLAKLPFSAMTPEEQKALHSALTFEKLRKAKKSGTQKAMKDFEEKGLDDPDTLRKTVEKETNLDKRLAAQILLLQKGGAEEDKQGNPRMSSQEKVEIGKRAKAVGLGSEVTSSLDPGKGEVEAVFGKEDTPQGARATRDHTAGAAKAIEDQLKSIEHLAEDATRSLMKTAANIHTKVAAVQKLANSKTLTPQDFANFEKFVQNSAQFGQVAKRYVHFAKEGLPATNPNSIASITKKMSRRDYSEIHEGLFDDPANLNKAKEFYRAAADAGIAEMSKNGKLRNGFQKLITDKKIDLASNRPVHDYLQKLSNSNTAFKYKL